MMRQGQETAQHSADARREQTMSQVDLSLNRAPEPWEEGQVRLLRAIKVH